MRSRSPIGAAVFRNFDPSYLFAPRSDIIAGNGVQTAEVRIAEEEDFGGRLTDMRLWLDEHRFEPSTFIYFYLDPGMMIRVSFSIADEAEAFAREFGGFLLEAQPARDRLTIA
jgi:hypothetical protein